MTTDIYKALEQLQDAVSFLLQGTKVRRVHYLRTFEEVVEPEIWRVRRMNSYGCVEIERTIEGVVKTESTTISYLRKVEDD